MANTLVMKSSEDWRERELWPLRLLFFDPVGSFSGQTFQGDGAGEGQRRLGVEGEQVSWWFDAVAPNWWLVRSELGVDRLGHFWVRLDGGIASQDRISP